MVSGGVGIGGSLNVSGGLYCGSLRNDTVYITPNNINPPAITYSNFPGNYGLAVEWNKSHGQGESSFINCGYLDPGGFDFWYCDSNIITPIQLFAIGTGGSTITATTPSTSPTTGALVVAGGVGIAGNVNVGGNLNIANAGGALYGVNGNALIISGIVVAQSGIQCDGGLVNVTTLSTSGDIDVGGNVVLSNNHFITAGTNTTLPSANQIGYTTTGTSAVKTISTGGIYPFGSITIPAGVYYITGQVSLSIASGSSTVTSYSLGYGFSNTLFQEYIQNSSQQTITYGTGESYPIIKTSFVYNSTASTTLVGLIMAFFTGTSVLTLGNNLGLPPCAITAVRIA